MAYYWLDAQDEEQARVPAHLRLSQHVLPRIAHNFLAEVPDACPAVHLRPLQYRPRRRRCQAAFRFRHFVADTPRGAGPGSCRHVASAGEAAPDNRTDVPTATSATPRVGERGR